MKQQTVTTKFYYSVPETFTSRTDIDPTMKWILNNFYNKLRIPKDKLPDGQYTFSVSNVSKEMGLSKSTTWNKFEILKKSQIIFKVGELTTANGTVVMYKVDTERFDKLMNGAISLDKVSHNKQVKAEVVPLLNKVGSLPPEQGSLPPEQGSLPIERINQIEQSNEVIKESTQIGKTESVDKNPILEEVIKYREVKALEFGWPDSVTYNKDSIKQECELLYKRKFSGRY